MATPVPPYNNYYTKISYYGNKPDFELAIYTSFSTAGDYTDPPSQTQIERMIIHKHADLIEKEIQASRKIIDPENIAWKAKWLIEAKKIFDAAGLTEAQFKEMPNRYCGPLCCPHKVWLTVATRFGEFVIGWRKRVINIEWGVTSIRVPESIFEKMLSNMNITHDETFVHAYSYEDAAQYLTAVINFAESQR